VVHGNWTDIFLDDVIADVTYEEAIAVPPGITNTIAMLVYHIKFYNDVVRLRLAGEEPVVGAANGFDVAINNDATWQQLKADCIESFKMIADDIKALPDEKLWEQTKPGGDSFYKNFHGLAEHGHYHLGEIVLLKKIIRHNKSNA
jgi:hypothetical protein